TCTQKQYSCRPRNSQSRYRFHQYPPENIMNQIYCKRITGDETDRCVKRNLLYPGEPYKNQQRRQTQKRKRVPQFKGIPSAESPHLKGCRTQKRYQRNRNQHITFTVFKQTFFHKISQNQINPVYSSGKTFRKLKTQAIFGLKYIQHGNQRGITECKY